MAWTIYVKRNQIPELIEQWQDAARQTVEEFSYVLEAEMKQNVVEKNIIDTGALLNSTQVQRFEDDGLTSYTGPSVEYAIHHEYGTRYMAARPFVGPAVESIRADFVRTLKERLQP